MKKYVIISICSLIFLSGCANALDIVSFYFSGPPLWVENPNYNKSNNDATTYLSGPCKSINDAKIDAINGFSNLIICDIKSIEETSKMVSSDNDSRQISTFLKTNLKSSSAVTLKGFVEINRWKNPITKEFYIQYQMSKQDFSESKKATEDKIQELINVDIKLKKSISNLDQTVEPSFIKHYYNSIDLYHAIINREWNTSLYVEVDSHLVQAEIFLKQYIKRIFASITIQLVTSNLKCEDTDEKELEFKITSGKYEDFSQIKLYLLNVDSKKEYISNSNKDGTFSFYVPSRDLYIGKNNFICSIYGLDNISLINNVEIPYKNIELNVIHTPETPSGLRLFLSNPPWDNVYLTWNSVDDASRYFIYRKEACINSNEYVKIASTFSNDYEDKNIEDNKRYLYRVTSVNNLSETESDVSIIKTIRTSEKPVLKLKVSKNAAVGCEEIIFYWNDIEELRDIDSKFKLQLIKDDKIYYTLSNIPNKFRYAWKVPLNVEEGNYFVKLIEENINLFNIIKPSIYLSGSHSHDGNKNEKIGILQIKDLYTDTGWVCNQQAVDQYQLQVNPFLFSHTFNINVQPINNLSDIGFEIVDLDSGKTKYKINSNGIGLTEAKTVFLKKGFYLIKIFYVDGVGGRYSFSCERIS